MESATSTVAIVFAHTIVDAPKKGAMSRAAAISAPRVETPTVKTIARSRRRLVRSAPGPHGPRADRPCAMAVPRPGLPALRRLRVRSADPHPAPACEGLQRPRDPRALPRVAGPAPARVDVALLPVAGLQAQRTR